MDDVIEFEATPDIVPALDLGKKKKKKKKKAVEDGETPRESLANAAPEVDFVDDAPPPPLDLGLKKKKKKKKAADVLNEGSSIDASDVVGKEQPSQESNESLIRSAFSSLEPGDGDNEHDENENAQEADSVTEAIKHESSSVQTDDVDISNEVEQFGEPRRPMTAAEKKKAKKEREKAAKKKKAAGKDKDIDIVFAELGDAQDASAEHTSGLASSSRSSIVQTELSKIDQRPVTADEVDGLLDELEPRVPAKSGAQKKKNKKKKKATQATDDADALLAEFDAPQPPSRPLIDEVPTTLGAVNVGDEPEDIASAEKEVGDLLAELGDDNDGSKMSAAQKKKAKKKKKAPALKADPAAESENPEEASEPAGDSKKTKKKKESAAVRRMREQLEKQKAEENRLRKIREEEEARIAEEERLKKEAEEKKAQEKARKKAAEKARRERKRQEGTLLTKAEKERRRRAEHFKQQLMAQGRVPMAASTVLAGNMPANGGPISVSEDGEQQNQKRVTYGSRRRRKVGPTVSSTAEVEDNEHLKEPEVVDEVPVESPTAKEGPAMEEPAEEEPVKSEPAKEYVSVPAVVPDAWDAISEDSNEDADTESAKDGIKRGEVSESAPSRNSLIRTGEESASSESESEDSDDSENEDDYEGMSKTEVAAEKRREAVRRAHEKQRQKAWEARSPDHLRSPIICILGHVDTGKTKILDRIRRTNVQDGEAGGITQQIGATYFPIDAVRKEAVKLVEGRTLSYDVPSLLIIDTPGHESFTNLRTRGSSLCDIAILVVDIMHGLEPQTKESIGLLKLRKTPFIVALNKIDRIYDWNAQPNNCPTRDALAKQKAHAQQEFNMRVRETKMQFMEEGFNTELYWDNDDPRKTISLVPTSAITGEGIPDLLMLLLALPQKLLVERLMFNTTLEATVLEVKVIEGLGTTIDIVLTGGTICEGDTIVVLGLDGPIVTTIRALLTPHPMKEMRVKGQYLHHKEIRAAQGIKISADGLEKAVAGTQLVVAADPDDDDELEYAKEEVMKDFTTILKSVDKSGIGVYVQASTLGSLEALLEFLRTSKIPVSGINIGPVHKKDIVKASTMLERRKEYATVLAFDVKVEPEAKELAEENGVQIFTADIIYHLFDQFTAYMEDVKRRRREEVNDDVVFPSICNILPQHIYNKKDPIIVGVDVLEGILRVGTPLVVQHGDGWLDIGRVAGIELNKKQVRIAKKGESVAVKIQHKSTENIMYGRHFDFKDKLVSKMSRRAIDLLKQNFKEDLGKEEWILVLKLKKMFNIL